MTNPRPIPDRMSVTDPSYRSDFGRGLLITLDGVEARGVLEYCISEGWLRRINLGADGKPVISGDEFEKERVEGVVAVTFRT